ncbi:MULTISPECIES: ADP-ribosylglycohydrolase family protein [Nonomuraea]|uniref:ADP-ribosylglycohydrolase family protein n=1 Tax=Nonomuraea mangrovi TaxID=2316207 RepID=A0ABW4SQX5_9ACTN
MSGDRITGAFVGLAVGDAAGWPAARHRSALHAPWSRRLHRELDAFAEEHRVTTLPVPFALNQQTAPLAVGPSDDAEWLAWTALTIAQDRVRAFLDLAERDDLRARISVTTALDNLRRGVEPPASGHDNPHFFDDAAAVRAVAFGATGRDPVPDARITNAGDGVLGAKAMAAAVGAAVESGSAAAAVEAALAELPEDSAIGLNARTALRVARKAGAAFAAVPELDAALIDHVYSYAVSASVTVPVALALAEVSGGSLAQAVPAAACLSAVADSAPALTGAITGACGGFSVIPEGWAASARRLAGCCLPELAGRDLVDISEGMA